MQLQALHRKPFDTEACDFEQLSCRHWLFGFELLSGRCCVQNVQVRSAERNRSNLLGWKYNLQLDRTRCRINFENPRCAECSDVQGAIGIDGHAVGHEIRTLPIDGKINNNTSIGCKHANRTIRINANWYVLFDTEKKVNATRVRPTMDSFINPLHRRHTFGHANSRFLKSNNKTGGISAMRSLAVTKHVSQMGRVGCIRGLRTHPNHWRDEIYTHRYFLTRDHNQIPSHRDRTSQCNKICSFARSTLTRWRRQLRSSAVQIALCWYSDKTFPDASRKCRSWVLLDGMEERLWTYRHRLERQKITDSHGSAVETSEGITFGVVKAIFRQIRLDLANGL